MIIRKGFKNDGNKLIKLKSF